MIRVMQFAVCVCQSADTGLASEFVSGADKCLGELLFSALENIEDHEIKVVDCSEDLLGAHQLRSPVKRLWSPVKVSVCLSVCLSVCHLSAPVQ